jgi:hypothetical protein
VNRAGAAETQLRCVQETRVSADLCLLGAKKGAPHLSAPKPRVAPSAEISLKPASRKMVEL